MIVYTRQGSVAVLQVTGSLLLLCCLIVVCFLLCSKNLTATKLLPGSLSQPVHSVGHRRCTVSVYLTSGAMASGDVGGSRPELTIGGQLDTSVVPDVLGLRALYEDVKPTRVLPGRAHNSFRVLIPDTRAQPQGFHDVTLVDMTNVSGPAVSTADMSHLQRQWPPHQG